MFNDWEMPDGRAIRLLKPAELDALPVKTKVFSIDGEEKHVGVDTIDRDTRYGFLAWGLLIEKD